MSNRIAIWFLGFLLFLAVFRDVIANGRPLYCQINGTSYWPGLRAVYSNDPYAPYGVPALDSILGQRKPFEAWKNPENFDAPPVYAPIPFSPGESSATNPYEFLPPGANHPNLPARFRHWLGTDAYGRDVAATLVSGARIALMTGSVAMGMALAIGLLLGTAAGYFGDNRLRVRRGRLWMTLLSLPIAWFYGFAAHQYELSISKSTTTFLKCCGIFIAVVLLFNIAGILVARLKYFSKHITLPADLVIMRVAEVFNALPKLIVIISLSVLFQRQSESIWVLIPLIGALSWTGVARFVRAELLKIREMEYVQAARGLGLPEWRILWKHALPNAMRPVLVVLALGVAGTVMLEASLSFLGFGDQAFRGISWGSLLARSNAQASPLKGWWVIFFPGLLICFTVLAFNALADKED